MKLDPTTGLVVAETPEEQKALDALAASKAAATTQTAGQPGEIKTGKQLRAEAGNTEIDWEARYNGMAGAMLQMRQGYETRIGDLNASLTAAKADIAARDTQLTELRPKAEGAATLQQQLEAEKAARATADGLTAKQQMLFKFPGLLKTNADGTENPLVAVLLGTNLPIAELEAKAKQLADSFGAAASAQVGNGVGSQMPAASGDGTETVESWRKKAQAAHDRAKYSTNETEKKTAEAESAQAWDKVKELEKKM